MLERDSALRVEECRLDLEILLCRNAEAYIGDPFGAVIIARREQSTSLYDIMIRQNKDLFATEEPLSDLSRQIAPAAFQTCVKLIVASVVVVAANIICREVACFASEHQIIQCEAIVVLKPEAHVWHRVHCD